MAVLEGARAGIFDGIERVNPLCRRSGGLYRAARAVVASGESLTFSCMHRPTTAAHARCAHEACEDFTGPQGLRRQARGPGRASRLRPHDTGVPMFRRQAVASESTARTRALLAACVAGVLLVACAPSEDSASSPTQTPAPDATPPAAQSPVPVPDTSTPAPAAGETMGGDGSQIQLDALDENDLTGAQLAGELACSFSVSGQAPLLFARGDVASSEAAQGIVKVAGYVEQIRSPGGFDGLTRNPTFTGQGKTILIEATGAAIGGGESPPRPATLTYQRADGASRVFEGHWQCGP